MSTRPVPQQSRARFEYARGAGITRNQRDANSIIAMVFVMFLASFAVLAV